jgi:hypothetical protein
MAEYIYHHQGMMLATNDGHPLCENFVEFLFSREISAFLVEPAFVHQPESAETRLGVRVAPGTC